MGGSADDLWRDYQRLNHAQRNDLLTRILREQLQGQKYLLYGWPVQRLYARYAEDFLGKDTPLRILELGPGDNLLCAALWMLDARVESLRLFDKFKGQFMDSAAYHEPLLELIQILRHLPREGFNNHYPFDEETIDTVQQAIDLESPDAIQLDGKRLSFVQGDDFTTFPFQSEQFNYIYSHAALEHYTDPEASMAEMNRVLEMGGLMAHQIDIRDHRYFEKDPFRYLEVSPENWNFGDLGFPVNQWRAATFRTAFERQGFEVLEACKIRRETEKLKGIALAPEFAALEKEAVAVTGIVFVLRKVARPKG
jgi:SAM-dependent methyltransferase